MELKHLLGCQHSARLCSRMKLIWQQCKTKRRPQIIFSALLLHPPPFCIRFWIKETILGLQRPATSKTNLCLVSDDSGCFLLESTIFIYVIDLSDFLKSQFFAVDCQLSLSSWWNQSWLDCHQQLCYRDFLSWSHSNRVGGPLLCGTTGTLPRDVIHDTLNIFILQKAD